MLPKVSVIIPVYNSEKIIERALDTILKQTYHNLEIIVIDDNSTDSSFLLAKKFESENLRVYKQPNSGAAIARNKGLSLATGKYIQFLDVDDFLSNNKIEEQVKVLEQNPGSVAVCNFIEFYGGEIPENAMPPADQTEFIFSSNNPAEFLVNLYGGSGQPNFIQTNSWLVPKIIIDAVGGWREFRCPDDDGEFFARVLLASSGVIYVPGIINYYRRTAKEASLSSNTKKKYLQNSLLTIDLKHRYLFAYTPIPNLNRAMAFQYLYFAIFSFPKHKDLSAIAFKRYKSLKTNVHLPRLGGVVIEAVKYMFGWRAARYLKYYLRENKF